VLAQRVLGQPPALPQDDERAQPLTELLVRHSDDGRLANRRMRGEQLLHLGGKRSPRR